MSDENRPHAGAPGYDRDIPRQDRPAPNQSIQKAIGLLRQTAARTDGASVSALARAAGLPRATALRLIQTMESEGLLIRIPKEDRVLLGPELLRLARQIDVGSLLREVSRGRLDELSEDLGETVTLSVVAPDGELDIVYQVSGPQHLVPRSWLGQRFALHASSSGKVLLATHDDHDLKRLLPGPLPPLTPHTITSRRALRLELERVRTQGYAATVDELEEGLAGVSVGIFDDANVLLGTINVNGLTQRLDDAARRRAIDRMRPVVDDIESGLGGRVTSRSA